MPNRCVDNVTRLSELRNHVRRDHPLLALVQHNPAIALLIHTTSRRRVAVYHSHVLPHLHHSRRLVPRPAPHPMTAASAVQHARTADADRRFAWRRVLQYFRRQKSLLTALVLGIVPVAADASNNIFDFLCVDNTIQR